MTDHKPDATDHRTEEWRQILTGEDPRIHSIRRWWRHVPSPPRCKICAAPFHGPAGLLTRLVMHGRSESNPLLCNLCFGKLRTRPGGAEIEISVLFADIRGSTGLAERLAPARFGALVETFYRIATRAVDRNGGIVDKFLGDGVMALFIPVITGENHTARAIQAGRELLAATSTSTLPDDGAAVGAGVHAGTAFVGVTGADERLDFTALGDTVNVAARLGSLAGAGELVVSAVAWDATGSSAADGSQLERRQLAIQGRAEPLEGVVLPASDRAEA